MEEIERKWRRVKLLEPYRFFFFFLDFFSLWGDGDELSELLQKKKRKVRPSLHSLHAFSALMDHHVTCLFSWSCSSSSSSCCVSLEGSRNRPNLPPACQSKVRDVRNWGVFTNHTAITSSYDWVENPVSDSSNAQTGSYAYSYVRCIMWWNVPVNPFANTNKVKLDHLN